jgi:DNA-directed RNA polymerase alpha subunit
MGKHLVATGMEDDETRIEAVDLTVRTYHCLKRSGISTVRQLFSLRKKEFLSLRNLTPHAAEEIRERFIACRFLHPTQRIGPLSEDDEDESS